MRSIIALLILSIALLSFHACGGSGSAAAPTAPTLTITKVDATTEDVTASGSATTVNPTVSFILTFVEAMSDSVTTAGNITYTCTLPDGSTVEQPTATVTASETTTYTYNVTLTAPTDGGLYQYQLLSCTLTVTTNVKNSAGTALASNAVFTLTNGAAASDDFNADSQSQWSVLPDEDEPLFSDWETLIAGGAAEFNTVGSSLDLDMIGADDSGIVIYKTVTVAADHSMELYIPSAANFVSVGSSISVKIHSDIDAKESLQSLWLNLLGQDLGGGIGACYFSAYSAISPYSEDEPFQSRYTASCPVSAGGYYLRFSKSGETFQIQYKSADSDSYSSMALTDGNPEMTDIEIEGDYYLSILMSSSAAGGDETAAVGSIYLEGVTDDDMY